MSSSFSANDHVIVKDDFYDNPDEIRNLALNKKYEEPPPGTPRLAVTAICNDTESGNMWKRLQPFVPKDPANPYIGANVLFRYTLADTQKRVFCPVDGCSEAGIVYLSLPEHCAGGTTIYRHKATGDEIYDKAHKHLYDFRVADQWEVVREVEMAYNRLVMYPGQLFHSITPVFFGDSIENARLTQNVFLYRESDRHLL